MRYALPILLLAACRPSTPTSDVTGPVPVMDSTPVRMAVMAGRLTGAWVDTSADGRTVFHEQWQPSGEGLHTGLGFVMSGPDTVFIEHLRMIWDGTDGRYSARIPSQNDGAYVDFALDHASDDSLVFLNPTHDFPQRISYVWNTPGVWNVTVSGIVNDTLRAERFELRPSPAPSRP